MPPLSNPFNAKAAYDENLIPEGTYPASVMDSAIRIGDDGAEEIIVVQMDVSVTPETSRSAMEWLRINSASDVALRIARKNLADLLTAVGIDTLDDTDDLIGKKLCVRVSVYTSDNYGPRNRFTFLPLDAQAAELCGA